MNSPMIALLPATTAESLPLIYDSPHSGNTYPADFRMALDMNLLRRSEDAFVEELFAPVTGLGGQLLYAKFPRCYIDTNRALEDIDVAMIAGEWPEPVTASGKLARGAGLIWRQVKEYGQIYDRQLSIEEVRHRIEHCWRPYHRALQDLLDQAWQSSGCVVHINCHSMASRGDHTTEDGPVARPDFILGDRDGTTCAAVVTDTVAAVLRGQGYEVALNDPYKGQELVRRYADPAAGRHSLQIEINRALYMNESSIEKTAGFEPLQQNLTLISQALAELAREMAAQSRAL